MSLINILIAEDNLYDYESAIRKLSYLDSIGKIIHVSDGAKAIEYLFKEGEYSNDPAWIKPDIILLDLRMPKVNGEEVLEKIKSNGTEGIKSIPAIIFTTVEDNFTNKKCFDLGARGFLEKPINTTHLNDMLIMLKLL